MKWICVGCGCLFLVIIMALLMPERQKRITVFSSDMYNAPMTITCGFEDENREFICTETIGRYMPGSEICVEWGYLSTKWRMKPCKLVTKTPKEVTKTDLERALEASKTIKDEWKIDAWDDSGINLEPKTSFEGGFGRRKRRFGRRKRRFGNPNKVVKSDNSQKEGKMVDK